MCGSVCHCQPPLLAGALLSGVHASSCISVAQHKGWQEAVDEWTHRKSPILLRAAAYTNVAKLGRMWDYLQALP